MTSVEFDGAHSEDTIRDVAARWVVRLDRRLSAEEKQELTAWLAADPRHAAAFEKSRTSWAQFRRIGQVARQTDPGTHSRSQVRRWVTTTLLAAAAAVILAVYLPRGKEVSPSRESAGTTASADHDATHSVTRRLPDGTLAQVSGATELTEAFTADERRVKFTRGIGVVYFVVAKEPARPFIVQIGNVTVRAIGTAFNVRAVADRVDVLVTEGTVHVNPEESRNVPGGDKPPSTPSILVGGQRASITHASTTKVAAIVVSAASPTEIAAFTASHAMMLDLAGATLDELVAVFTQRTGQRIELGDADLAAVRIGGRVPSGDVEGFLHALEQLYDVKRELRSDGVIVLRKRL
jgi:transmembrane sensor